MNIIASVTIEAVRQHTGLNLPFYESILQSACDEHTPIFGAKEYGDGYRKVACEPTWMATSILANACREAEGSMRLANLAAATADAELSSRVIKHAADESRHARMYSSILKLIFPGKLTTEVEDYVKNLSFGYLRQEYSASSLAYNSAITIDELIQMNIAEIRTRIHQLLQRPIVLAYCASDQRASLLPILDSLLYDETEHISYTAILIEQLSAKTAQNEVKALYAKRLDDFNKITNEDIGNESYDGG